MTVATQACPFCNASVPESVPAGRRLTCPRCGETFAPRGSAAIQDVESPSPAPEVDRYLGRQPDVRGRNRRVGILVVCVMIAMAGGGLALALMTQAQRRAQDTNLPRSVKNSQTGEEVIAVPPGPVPAAKSPLIGYVPEGTNVLLGVNLAELRNSPQGLELLQQKISIGGQSLPLDITPWTGLTIDDVDYFLLTATVSTKLLESSLALLVHTHREVNKADLIRSLKATKDAPSGTNAPTWRFRPPGQKFDWSVRIVNDHTLALGIMPGHLMGVPVQPRVGLGHLSESLSTCLSRIKMDGMVWLATNVDQATREQYLGHGDGKGKAALNGVRTLAAWVRPGTPFTLSAVFCCADGGAAEVLHGYLAGLAPDMHEPDLEFAVEDACLRVERRAGMATILETIGKGMKR